MPSCWPRRSGSATRAACTPRRPPRTRGAPGAGRGAGGGGRGARAAAAPVAGGGAGRGRAPPAVPGLASVLAWAEQARRRLTALSGDDERIGVLGGEEARLAETVRDLGG